MIEGTAEAVKSDKVDGDEGDEDRSELLMQCDVIMVRKEKEREGIAEAVISDEIYDVKEEEDAAKAAVAAFDAFYDCKSVCFCAVCVVYVEQALRPGMGSNPIADIAFVSVIFLFCMWFYVSFVSVIYGVHRTASPELTTL